MKGIVIVLVIASGLVGCATHTRHTGEGSALPREALMDAEVERLIAASAPDPSHKWSVRDFMTPRGLFQ